MFTFFTKIQQPSIYLLGVQIDEPITALTGLLIVAFCGYYCWQLRHLPIADRSAKFVHYGLAALGASTLFGAILGHAFLYELGKVWKLPGWLLGNLSGYFFAMASLSRYYANKKGTALRNIRNANIAALLLSSWMAITTLDFFWTMSYTAFALLGTMLPLELKMYQAGERLASPLFLKGIWIMVASVVPIIVKFSISPWFNYLDIGHLFVCVTVAYFYRALLALHYKVLGSRY